MADRRHGAVAPLPLAQLMLFDFRPAQSEDDALVAAERAHTLCVSVPFLAASHLFWCAILLFGLAGGLAPGELVRLCLPLAAVLALDAALFACLRRRSLKPYQAVRLAAAHAVATAGLWGLAIVSALGGGAGDSILAQAALVAGIGVAIPAYFTIPALLSLNCLTTVGWLALLDSEHPLVGIGAAVSFYLVGLGLYRARDLIFSAHRRLAIEWEAKKARRFVTDYEESGRGWFWETNADGVLTYISDQLSSHFSRATVDLIGRRFEDVVLDQQPAAADEARRTLDFHLSARFPFAEVIVRAPGSEEVWWSLSGSPNFDNYGRFLGFRGIGTNLSEQRRCEAETSKLARYDSLTGLPNRAMMRATLDAALANAAERRKGCALLTIDLDRFKQVNDTLGHPVGDKLLKKVATRLKQAVGGEGQVGRLGGDEFEAILPGVEEEGPLAHLARRLIDEVSRPYRIDGHEISIGTSIGIAIARPGKAYAAALIKDADLALYAAKADGRGIHRFFDPAMHAEAADRQILESDLKDALAKGQLKLLFQPIVDSVSEEVVAFEALLRWHHPTRGVLPPARIIPLAEDSGLMSRIGDWVLRTACAEAAKWPAHIRVAVNLSPLQFVDAALPATVTSTLASSRLDPERLELEITEGVFLADSSVTGQTLAKLKAIGVRLALDNFGTGHSGLGHLRNAPLDKIKIDQSFVRGAGAPGSRNGAIVRAIVVLAESLGMDTTAEGAETLDELALIRRLGCSQVQGFIFSQPVDAEAALRLATESRPSADVIGFTRPPRHRMIRMGTLHWDGRTLPVRLRNISAGGAMIECERPIPPDTAVQLDLAEGGLLDAEIRWCQRGQIGLKFVREFELRKLARPRRGGGGPRMLTPDYLSPGRQAAAGPISAAAKSRRKGA
jgi:diguanylate cyclase (GGDEF)-like protein